ncbi:MAG: T9SS type A sorting domain-containing protein [Bacteroidetes bacterium]|nr:T9SS type A sorting domain-containing protein [Bacteroidota bacterium]
MFPFNFNIGTGFLILFLFLTGIAPESNAQVQLRIPDTTATAEDTLNIPVYVDNNLTGQGVYSYQVRLTYDFNLLDAVNVIVNGTVSQPFGTPVFNTPSPGIITVAAAGIVPLTGSGIFLYVQFHALQSGYSVIAFTDTIDNMLNEGVPSLNLINGSINIIAAPAITVYPDNYLLTTGDSLQFNVTGGTTPFQWSVTDTSVATIDANGLFHATDYGFTKVRVQDSTGLIDTTNGIIEIRALSLTIRDTSALQGSTIDIPVYTTALNNLYITSGSFSLSYDPGILTAVSVITTGTLLASYSAPTVNTGNPGQVDIAFAGITPLTGSGILLYVRFNVSSQNTGGTAINFSNVIFNQDILATVVNGYFSILPLPSLYILPNTAILLVGDTLQFSVSGGTAPYSWSTSDTGIASINLSGLLTALQGGAITVMVTDSLGASGTSGIIQIYDTYVSIPDTSVCPLSDTIDLPLYIGNLPNGESVSSIQSTITFQTPELNAINIVSAGTLTDGWSYTQNIINGNQFVFAGAGSDSFSNGGIIVIIRFLVTIDLSVGETVPVTISDILLNEGAPLPLVVNGSITRLDSLIANATTPNGPANLCFNSPDTGYYTSGITNAISYIWTITPPSAGTTTDSGTTAIIDWDSSFSGYAAITVMGVGMCGTGSSSDSLIIMINPLPSVVITPSGPTTICAGDSIMLSATTAAIYLWSTGETVQDIFVSDSGVYQVTITDANGCTAAATIAISEFPVITAAVTPTGSTCGNSDGSATVLVSGGTSPYTYLWSTGDSQSTINNLPAAIYSVTVTDANGCSSTSITAVNDLNGPNSTTLVTDATCGNSNGSATANNTGGTPPFSYYWSTGETTQSIGNLFAGSYSVTVTDSSGCIAAANVTVNNISGPSVTAAATDAACGNANGSATATASGGTPPYTYLWSNGGTQSVINNLLSSFYYITVTDSNGCIATANVIVNEIYGPTATVTATDAACGNSDGTATVFASGGNAPYTYNWNTGSTATNINNLAAGSYVVTVTDSFGCTVVSTVAVNNTGAPVITIDSITNVICNGNSDGAIYLTATGSSSLTYLWSNADTAEDALLLPVGTYSVSVSDTSGCTGIIFATITEPAAIIITAVVDDANAPGNNDGAIDITVTGGTGSYTYLWSNSETTEDISGLSAATYTVTVSDANNCQAVYTDTVKLITGFDMNGEPAAVMVFPNPYRDETNIQVSLNSNSYIVVEVYSVTGKKITVLADGLFASGIYNLTFNAKQSGYPAGIYLLKVNVNDRIWFMKLVEME